LRRLLIKGSIGTKFYIILQGKVEVLIKSNNPFSNSIYIPVMDYTTGNSFGELAIMDEALKPRKATIRCVESSHFATLTRKSFQSFLGHFKKEFEAQIEAFTMNPLFSRAKWSNRLVDQWVKSFTPMKNLQRNTIIYKEGDASEQLYFIKSGQVVNTKKMTIDRPSNIHKDIILDERNQIFQIDHAKLSKEVEISVWSEGTLFGEEETFQVFKHERQLEKERDKFKKEFQDRFEEERTKIETIGYRYKPPKELMLPEDPSEDEKVIEQLLNQKIAELTQGSNKRETTVTVISHSAEIWVISRNVIYHLSSKVIALLHATRDKLDLHERNRRQYPCKETEETRKIQRIHELCDEECRLCPSS
jgi:CRP-like cAMP-binding protein